MNAPLAGQSSELFRGGVTFRPSREVITAAAYLLVFVAATLIAIGYCVGQDDQLIHLVFLARALDPNFLPGDLLANSAARHLSLFWALQAPLVRSFGLERTYLVIHLLSVAAMVGGTAMLARALVPPERAWLTGWLACVPAILGGRVFGYISAFDALVLNRTVVLGLELIALALVLRGRVGVPFLVIGLMANIHATTALHTAALAGAVVLFERGRLRRIPVAIGSFLLGAVPLIVMWFGKGSSPLDDYQAWRSAVVACWPFHHFAAWMGLGDWLRLAIPCVVILARLRIQPSRALAVLLATTLAMVLSAYIMTDVFRLRISVQLHLNEVGRLLTYLGYAAAADIFLLTCAAPLRSRLFGALLLGAVLADTVISLFYAPTWMLVAAAAAVFLAAAFVCVFPPDPKAKQLNFPAFLVPLAALIVSVIVHQVRGPGASFAWRMANVTRVEESCRFNFRSRPELTAREVCGLDLMEWAKTNLPADALVVEPPFMHHPLNNFRFITGRQVLVNLKDGGEALFDSAFTTEWLSRMNAIAGPLEVDEEHPGRDTWMKRLKDLHKRFNNGGLERVRALRTRFGATHMICRSDVPCGNLGLPVLYEDRAFRLVSLSEGSVMQATDRQQP